jgi:hypothetical protein
MSSLFSPSIPLSRTRSTSAGIKRSSGLFALIAVYSIGGIFPLFYFKKRFCMPKNVFQEYDTKLDIKKRCVIHGIPSFNRYHVKVFNSGKIEMTPRILASPEELSAKTLRMIYGSIKTLKKGKAGSAVNFEKYQDYLKDEK